MQSMSFRILIFEILGKYNSKKGFQIKDILNVSDFRLTKFSEMKQCDIIFFMGSVVIFFDQNMINQSPFFST